MKRCLQNTGKFPTVSDGNNPKVITQAKCFSKAIVLFATLFFVFHLSAQSDSVREAYLNTITARSAKIVNTLSIKDSVKYKSVLDLLVHQYDFINQQSENFTAAKKDIGQKNITPDEKSAQVKVLEQQRQEALNKAHQSFVRALNQQLDSTQVELVKDGITYRILPVTFGAYQEMLLNLTAAQKAQIYTWLVEARELAMDAESSDKKHAVFGKYKGRINNYLAQAGYDLKKETDAWQQRIKDKKAKTTE